MSDLILFHFGHSLVSGECYIAHDSTGGGFILPHSLAAYLLLSCTNANLMNRPWRPLQIRVTSFVDTHVPKGRLRKRWPIRIGERIKAKG